MFVTILVIIVVVSGVLVLILTQSKTGNKKSWVQFFAKGKDAGFSIKEIELLRKLAVKCALSDPSSLFWSQSQLDTCIKDLVRATRLAGGSDQATQDFLSKLYDYRNKIELDRPKVKKGISDSRQIEEGQTLRILVDGYGVFPSKIVKNAGQFINIVRPASPKLPTGFSWIGLKLSVYFWRGDDAGYVFDSNVQDEVFSRGEASLKIGHADNLFRTQKRRSVRLKTHKPAFLYLLDDNTPSSTIEMNPGLKCFVEDLSDSGCAVLVGGRAAASLRIKVQFILNNRPICLSGTVRSMEYNEEKYTSLLHVKADPLAIDIRNHIMGEVFGMLPEEDDELPFRILDEEAAEETNDGTTEKTTAEVQEASVVAEEAL